MLSLDQSLGTSSHLTHTATCRCQNFVTFLRQGPRKLQIPRNEKTTSQYLSERRLLSGVIRPIKPGRAAAVPADVTADEGTDWLGMLWSLAASLVAPDDEEEEGIHQLTEALTCKKTSHSLAW